ncbi:phosphotransferase family protein [Actinopolymorpha singaporensis]|uniref:Predicted kinase, aminoglycoside phosphotransferase (APT) family n=1 Tax=Actinopolymorpha singaporensis TaxID=117157 RepID=A0A1H1L5J8_9ACTN|nr:aminoglycoside phosphotransferase family protein [Actinopolymorpha singaporensis]SDR69572.1 Predicted kinase, aminoglycoside phosphotransferase (APT) family [Actinopolymorpha singaporensis]
MESITKNRQSPRTLKAMVARAYGPDQVPADGDGWVSELGHGWFNVAYRIRLRDGSNVVVKIAPPAGVEVMTYERGAMAVELAALRLIREQTTVPVPTVDFADSSHELCDADYFFMPYIDADNLGIVKENLTPACLGTYQEALGAANRELNSIRGRAFGPLAGPGEPSWRVVFTGMFEDVLGDGERRQVDLGWDYDVVREVFADNAGSLEEVVEPRYVEWDLWDSNVMVRDGKIISIIDHERAFYGDPLIEAGFVPTQLAAFGDATAFMRGYGQGKLTETEQVRRRLYCLHLALIMVIETVYRGHTDSGQYDWAREQVAELMGRFGHRSR